MGRTQMQSIVIAVLIIIVFVLAFLARSRKFTTPASHKTLAVSNPQAQEIELTYRELFGATANSGEYLIGYYMQDRRCTRLEAMREAIEDLLIE
jgi:hypothetical protein